jgi:hypothetical protein
VCFTARGDGTSNTFAGIFYKGENYRIYKTIKYGNFSKGRRDLEFPNTNC